MIPSAPLKEIVTKPAEVKELYLAKKGFNTLCDFERFINLEILWLNNNLITQVVNLDACTRIRKLYLQDNKITTLDGSISKFKFLEVLLLHNNSLRDLQSVLDHLDHHRHLKQLNLLGNPCAEEEGYREIVISRLPLLEIFDRHVVTAKERSTADQKLLVAPQLFRTPSMESGSATSKRSKQGTTTELLLDKEAQKLKAVALQREKLAQQQQQEADALLAASKERVPADHLPLPEALDFLKKRQVSAPPTPFTLPPINNASRSSSPSNTKRNALTDSSDTSSSRKSQSLENSQRATFQYAPLAYFTKDHLNNSASLKVSGDATSPPRVRVTIK